MSGSRCFRSSVGSASWTISLAAPDLDHLLGQLEGVNSRVADVHRHVLAALGQQDQAADEIVHVAEAPRLRPSPNGEAASAHCLADESPNRATVVGARGP
jgi:hypothetical protein